MYAQCEAEVINSDLRPQQTMNTENLRLNALTGSISTCSDLFHLFSIILFFPFF